MSDVSSITRAPPSNPWQTWRSRNSSGDISSTSSNISHKELQQNLESPSENILNESSNSTPQPSIRREMLEDTLPPHDSNIIMEKFFASSSISGHEDNLLFGGAGSISDTIENRRRCVSSLSNKSNDQTLGFTSESSLSTINMDSNIEVSRIEYYLSNILNNNISQAFKCMSIRFFFSWYR